MLSWKRMKETFVFCVHVVNNMSSKAFETHSSCSDYYTIPNISRLYKINFIG